MPITLIIGIKESFFLPYIGSKIFRGAPQFVALFPELVRTKFSNTYDSKYGTQNDTHVVGNNQTKTR